MSNLTFDWSAVTMDFLGHPLDPKTDLSMAAAMLWDPALGPPDQAQRRHPQSEDLVTSVPPSWPTPAGVATVTARPPPSSTTSLNGTVITADFNMYFDPTMFPATKYSYLVAVATGTTLGQGFRMLQTFTLDPASSETTVKLTN